MSDNDNERKLEMALSRSTLVRLLDYNRGLVVALEAENARLRAELAVANAARGILQRAAAGGDVTAAEWSTVKPPEPCPCCASGLAEQAHLHPALVCKKCDHRVLTHSVKPEPCGCCDRGLDKSATVPDMLAECPTCHHEWIAHDKPEPCACCARGVDHGRFPALWACLACDHRVRAHSDTRTEGFGPSPCKCCARGLDLYPAEHDHFLSGQCLACDHAVAVHNTRTEGEA